MVNNVAVKVSNLSKEFLLGQDKTISILKDVLYLSIMGNLYQYLVSVVLESLLC